MIAGLLRVESGEGLANALPKTCGGIGGSDEELASRGGRCSGAPNHLDRPADPEDAKLVMLTRLSGRRGKWLLIKAHRGGTR
ncbi:hypothetical protein PJH54_30000, partial [Mycobacterium kansasii]